MMALQHVMTGKQKSGVDQRQQNGQSVGMDMQDWAQIKGVLQWSTD
jgi:hypothetical protein